MNYEYLDNLILKCQKAKEIQPIRKFLLKNLSELETISKAIYIIRLKNGDEKEIFNKLKRYKEKKERACPKLNAPSSVLYIGSSTTNLKQRIKQHLGEGSKSTYALHLKYWLENFQDRIEIEILGYEQNIEIEVFQLIEDNLSFTLKPAFGKRGANNK